MKYSKKQSIDPSHLFGFAIMEILEERIFPVSLLEAQGEGKEAEIFVNSQIRPGFVSFSVS